VEARVNGRPKRLTVGRADLLSVDEARKEAICLLAQMTSGTDPQVEKQKLEASLITLGEVLDHYLSMQRLKPTYKKNLHCSILRYLDAWLRKPIASITYAIAPRSLQARPKRAGTGIHPRNQSLSLKNQCN